MCSGAPPVSLPPGTTSPNAPLPSQSFPPQLQSSPPRPGGKTVSGNVIRGARLRECGRDPGGIHKGGAWLSFVPVFSPGRPSCGTGNADSGFLFTRNGPTVREVVGKRHPEECGTDRKGGGRVMKSCADSGGVRNNRIHDPGIIPGINEAEGDTS